MTLNAQTALNFLAIWDRGKSILSVFKITATSSYQMLYVRHGINDDMNQQYVEIDAHTNAK